LMRLWLGFLLLVGCGAVDASKVNVLAVVTDNPQVSGSCLWVRAGDLTATLSRDGGRQAQLFRLTADASVQVAAEIHEGSCLDAGAVRAVDRQVVLARPGAVVQLLIQSESRDLDGDGDGFNRVDAGGLDCDDTRAEVNPSAMEQCDQQDRNCDGRVGCVELAACASTCFPDGGAGDSGVNDSGVDGGRDDAGVDAGFDGGTRDAGVDAGQDAGVVDAGVDSGVPDAGLWLLTGGRAAPLLVGECVAFEITRPVGSISPFTFAVGSGVSVHQDAMCQFGPPAAVVSGNRLTAYVRGTSAEPGVRASVQLVPTLGASSNTITFAPLPLVRRGSCTLTNQDVTCAELDGGSLGQSFLVFQASSISTQANEAMVRCRLDDAPFRVECNRGMANTQMPVQIEWQVVSHARAIEARHAAIVFSGRDDQPLQFAPPLVSMQQGFVLGSEFSAGTIINGNNYISMSLASNAAVSFRAGFDRNRPAGAAFQVVSMQGVAVDHALLNGFPFSPQSLLVSGVATSRQLVLTSVTDESQAETSCLWGARSFLDGGSAYLARGAGLTNSACMLAFEQVSVQRINFPPGNEVRAALVEFTGASTAQMVPLTGIQPHRTLVLASDQSLNGQSGGETSWTSTGIQANRVLLKLQGQQLEARLVGNGGATSRFTVWVVQLNGY
jgi:hypothetical protein